MGALSALSALSGLSCVAGGDSGATKPVNTVSPSVSPSTALIGDTIDVSNGVWSGGGGAIVYTYAWRTGGIPNGGTGSTYVVQASDNNQNVDCVVTATNSAGSTNQAASNQCAVAQPAPINTAQPQVSPMSVAWGSVISCDGGTWDGFDISLSYQWVGTSGPISGATSSTYTTQSSDVAGGGGINCNVTATDGLSQQTTAMSGNGEVTAQQLQGPTITLIAGSAAASTITITFTSNGPTPVGLLLNATDAAGNSGQDTNAVSPDVVPMSGGSPPSQNQNFSGTIVNQGDGSIYEDSDPVPFGPGSYGP